MTSEVAFDLVLLGVALVVLVVAAFLPGWGAVLLAVGFGLVAWALVNQSRRHRAGRP